MNNNLFVRWHKLTHWEYWPSYIVYAPTFLLWIFSAIRFRSFTFYKKSNPAITNGGLFGDSKFEIQSLLPSAHSLKTLLIKKGVKYDFSFLFREHKMSFPVIVKPDVGCRGFMVQKVYSFLELEEYREKLEKDFLIQDFCDYPNEMGLFYCRLPGEVKGKITGLTLKKFLTVSGDGEKSIGMLLKKNPRHYMQLHSLKDKINLDEVLPEGQSQCLVPYGNHCRGTEFIDGKILITDRLEETFNRILSNIDGFYFGRLDIRYATLEELERGERFAIIELNGAKSEPTHIYDSATTFWNGQKEIFRHQRIFFRIINAA